jgi:hypothetical protein
VVFNSVIIRYFLTEALNLGVLGQLSNNFAIEKQSVRPISRLETYSNVEQQMKAERSIATTPVMLAHFYETGIGSPVNKNPQQVVSMMTNAAQQEDIVAMYCLGMMYMEGEGVVANTDQARRLFQQIVDKLKLQEGLFAHFANLKLALDKHDKPDYPTDMTQWIGLLAQNQLRILAEKADKNRLEDLMATAAHRFRGNLQSIEYYAENETILENVRTMRSWLNTFSFVSIKSGKLRDKLLQDMQGEGTLLSVLEHSLAVSLISVLTLHEREKIRQHYLNYAKRTGQVSATTTQKQWKSNHLNLELQLQADWQSHFMNSLNAPSLDKIIKWLEERFFPVEIQGFAEAPIHFERYGATEATLQVIMSEIFTNALKYYASETSQPVQICWTCDTHRCQFVCANPTSEKEQLSGKGNYKGHHFLSMIAKILGGHFPPPRYVDDFVTEFGIPTYLLMEKNV